ncbi:MAG: ribosome maturation factor RimM [Caldimicrobium sp.]|nr:ribosome maturation factor RimM [Caldimicrobium sp.]MCX7874436.1 ribosome maturation factor RimM [Caldimicrobium sp.]MDW8094949.1 ribosome maturation factor RimM [Caldimicrobium sp.]
MTKRKLIPFLKILGTHGRKGDLKVALLTTNEELIQTANRVISLYPQERILSIKGISKASGLNQYIISFEDLTYDNAKALVNQVLYINPQDLPEPSSEEVYYFQLENLKVIDKEGKIWGKVIGSMPVGEYTLLLIKSEEKGNFYVPLVDEYVEEINLAEGFVKVKDIKDLVEVQS